MKDVQPRFTYVEYAMRRGSTRRETFLSQMEDVRPWVGPRDGLFIPGE